MELKMSFFQEGIKCPHEYHGIWRNENMVLEITKDDVIIHTGKRKKLLRGRTLKDYYDYGYSVSFLMDKKYYYYFSLIKITKKRDVVLFKLSRMQESTSICVHNEKLKLV